MVAGQNGPNRVYFSKDGINFTRTEQFVDAELHSFLITDKLGNFWGWATNALAPLAVMLQKKATPADNSRFYIRLSDLAGTTANGNFVISSPRGIGRRISNVRFGFTQNLSADPANFWTFELRHRRDGGTLGPPTVQTISGSTAATATSNNNGVAIPGVFTILPDVALQAFWTKTGTPAGPGYLWLEFTEHP